MKTKQYPVSQVVAISTPQTLSNYMQWEMELSLNFDPSASNFARIYLMSNQANLKGSLNGYFLQIGESGNADSYDLYRQTGNTITKIIDAPPVNRVNSNNLSTKIKVNRSLKGEWQIAYQSQTSVPPALQ